MNAPEYAATVQALDLLRAGRVDVRQGRQARGRGAQARSCQDCSPIPSAHHRRRRSRWPAPLLRSRRRRPPAACYYNVAADFAAIYDTKFIDALHPAAQLRTASAISAAVAYINDNEPFAVVMPIRAEPNAARAIRAFFTEAAEDNTKTDEADKLRAELAQAQEEAAALRGDLYRAANEIDEMKNKLAELHETKTEQPAEQKPEPKTAAEIIAARWARWTA